MEGGQEANALAKKHGKAKPLGYVMLESGPKEIIVMNDMFTNYHFRKKEYWEDLRSIANIFIKDYKLRWPDTALAQKSCMAKNTRTTF